MGTPRNFSNTASGASLNGTLAAGATSALLNNYSNFPAAPFTATISRNQADEEIVLVTAVTGSTVTLTRGYDGSSAQGHSAGATFEHTAVATDFREAQAHVNATAAHGTSSALVGVDDTQTLTAKTVKQLKALANASGAGVEADNESGTQGKLFRGLNAGVEKFFVDYLGNLTAGSVTGTTGSLSGLLTAGGGVTVPTGKKVTLTDAPSAGTDAANKTYVDAGDATGKSYADAGGRFRGAGTSLPSSPITGDTFSYTGYGLLHYNGASWEFAKRPALADATAVAAIPAGLLYDGLEVVVTADAKAVWRYDGSVWRGKRYGARIYGPTGTAVNNGAEVTLSGTWTVTWEDRQTQPSVLRSNVATVATTTPVLVATTEAGYYTVSGRWQWAGGPTGSNMYGSLVVTNPSGRAAGTYRCNMSGCKWAGASWTVYLEAGATISVVYSNFSGSNLAVEFTELTIQRVDL